MSSTVSQQLLKQCEEAWRHFSTRTLHQFNVQHTKKKSCHGAIVTGCTLSTLGSGKTFGIGETFGVREDRWDQGEPLGSGRTLGIREDPWEKQVTFSVKTPKDVLGRRARASPAAGLAGGVEGGDGRPEMC